MFACRSHLIEVATEASLQPLLQFYLFLPALITTLKDIGLFSTLRVADITSTRSIQLLSVVMSVLSMSYSFTTNYRKNKHEAMGACDLGSCIYFVFTLCMVTSR